MKVNGVAFKRAREEIRKNSPQVRNKLRGDASVGTQEWLACKAKIKNKNGKLTSLSVRTIQYLEKGEASIQVVDAVSPFLQINGRELIFDYGVESVKLKALGVIDFRPAMYPESSNTFYKSPLLMSVDPLAISFDSDDLSNVEINSISAKLLVGGGAIKFRWLYEVELTENGKGWLGIKNEVSPIRMNSPETYISPIMFKQVDPLKLSWFDFIKAIEAETTNLMQINVAVDFTTFTKELKIGVSISETRAIVGCDPSREYSRYIQPYALTWK